MTVFLFYVAWMEAALYTVRLYTPLLWCVLSGIIYFKS